MFNLWTFQKISHGEHPHRMVTKQQNANQGISHGELPPLHDGESEAFNSNHQNKFFQREVNQGNIPNQIQFLYSTFNPIDPLQNPLQLYMQFLVEPKNTCKSKALISKC